MSIDSITPLIIEYRYWILAPLTFIEGPIVAFVAGTLSATGFFNVYGLAALFFVRDVGLDLVYYSLGYFGGNTAFAHRVLKKLKITSGHLAEIKQLWSAHPGKTLFIGKLSYGIASAFIVVAGMVKMPLGKFVGWGSVVAIVQYGGLLALGFFFGSTLGGTIPKMLENLQYAVAGLAIFISAYYTYGWYNRGKFIEGEQGQHGV